MRRSRRSSPLAQDQSAAGEYLHAATVYVPIKETISVTLVGCGGTGSWLAPSLARLAFVMQKDGKPIHLAFVDPDMVEVKNIGRQNFCQAEEGKNKAEALAVRYARAWGLEITYRYEEAEKAFQQIWRGNNTHIIIGCVDNAKGRKSIKETIDSENLNVWWLDCGNGRESGQVLLGNCTDKKVLEKTIRGSTCRALPAPSLQAPNLLVPRPEEMDESRLSCAELAAANMQDLAVNQRAAAEAADMLFRMLVTRNLKRFATYFDLSSGTATSKYCTQAAILKVTQKGK